MPNTPSARAQLERSEKLLRITGEAAGIGWWDFDVATGTLEYSEIVNRIHGLEGPQEWPVERAMSYYQEGPELDNLLEVYGRCLTEGTPYEADFKIRTEQGEIKWIRARGQAHRNEAGEIDRVTGSFQDVDGEKRKAIALAQREFILQRNFDNAPYGMLIVNMEGGVERVSKSFAEMLGYTVEEFMEIDLNAITHPDDRSRDQEIGAAFVAGSEETFRWEKRHLHKTGRVVWGDVALTCVRDRAGNMVSFHAQIVDITAARQAQARDRHLDVLRDKAREMERFTYVASHDLRQPVLTLMGYAQALREDFGDSLPEDGEYYLEVMDGALQRMDTMVKGLLEYSRLSKAKSWQPVSLSTLVDEVVKELRESIAETGATIDTGELPEVYGYPLELRQLLRSLIANALQYRRPEVAPRVHLTCDDIDGGHRFTVEDNGRGIAVGDRERIFGLFQRAKGGMHVETDEGTGIGLANCRLIVERHGGEITLESEVGKGSSFSFTLLTAAFAEEE